ncbi:MAG: TatD family hydrolase [Clostridia bacterium]|nr:TatD family hydrolase [Clostridia bacterium]
MEKIFDSHAHYDDERFDEDRQQVLEALRQDVCAVINCASDLESARCSLDLAEKYDYIYAAVGIHPHEAAQLPADWLGQVEKLAGEEKAVAIGEIGLDYHYDFCPRDIQKQVFAAQVELAKKLNLPIIVHDREAHGDMYEILRKYAPLAGVVHCFSGSAELARETVSMGMHIGLGGAVTFKNARVPLEVAQFVPMERLLLETDAPYMAPVPFRGKRCDSSHIRITAEKIAQVKGVTTDELIARARENAEKLFLGKK